MYSQQHLMMQQMQLQQLQQQRRPSVAEPVVFVPFNIPTKLNNTYASAPQIRPQEPGGPLPINYEPTNLDVCSGRGKRNWNHSGNVAFRDLIQHSTSAYMAATTKNEKTAIVCNIVEEMRTIGCKFLKEDSKTGRWYDIGDAQAREKVGHSLRDQVTAYNRSNVETPDATHHRTLSDSGKEADTRRMSLDTTVLFGQFARRPSWLAQSENGNFSDAATVTPTTGDFNVQNVLPLQQSQRQQIEVNNRRNEEKASLLNESAQVILSANVIDDPTSNVSRIAPVPSQPTSTTPVLSSLPYEVRKHAYPKINENTEFDPTQPGSSYDEDFDKEYERSSRRGNPRESITMTDILSWDPNSASNHPQVMDSMLQDSVQSWDPRLSSTTSLMSVRRSHIMNMAGSTTLRRLTNNFRTSEISMQSIQSFIDGMDFDVDDDYDDNNFEVDVFATKNQIEDTTPSKG